MNALSLIAVLLLVGCVTMAPVEERRIELVETTEIEHQPSFDRALSWVEEQYGSPQIDSERGEILIRGKTLCNHLKSKLDPNDYTLQYQFYFRTKNKKLTFRFSDLEIVDKYGNAVNREQPQITTTEKVQLVRPCLVAVKDEVLKAIHR